MSIKSLFIEKKRPRHPSEMPGLCPFYLPNVPHPGPLGRFRNEAIEPNTSSLGDGKTGALSVTLPAAD